MLIIFVPFYILGKKQQQTLSDSSNDEEYSEDESDILLKPKCNYLYLELVLKCSQK